MAEIFDEEYVKEEDFKITEITEKNNWKIRLEKFLDSRYFVATVIILIAVISFALGRVSSIQEKRPPVRIVSENQPPNNLSNSFYVKEEIEQTAAVGASGQVVASKSGTKYHYPWCAGAKQISEKNKIVFNSVEEARSKGYTPASNCKGLK